MNKKVCHITSAHGADDIRIFHKECLSLAENDYDVHLVAKGNVVSQNANFTHHVLDTHSKFGRLGRILFSSYKAYRMAKKTDAQVFHFHDPELLPYGLLLKLQGKSVIYDAHEDLPRDILIKDWIPAYVKKNISWLSEKLENFIARHVDQVVAATPFIAERFELAGAKAVDIKNFPRLHELQTSSIQKMAETDVPAMCYVGLITQKRGIIEMIHAAEILNIKLILAGNFDDARVEQYARSLAGWRNVEFLGKVTRGQIAGIFAKSKLGLCILHPVATFSESMPIKLFEYMSASLPVICSNFLSWEKIIGEEQCGLSVDPMNLDEIILAIQWVLDNPEEAKKMGEKGRQAVETRYHWEIEAEKLLDIYKQLTTD